MDKDAAKVKERETWTRVTPGWRKYDAELVEWTNPVTAKMLDRARIGPGHRVLDIACGTGQPAIPAAERVGPTGTVVGTDFVDDMLAFAREKAARLGLRNLEFQRQDGEELDAPADSFDAVTLRFGLMFMPDPVRCLVKARSALKPGGRIAVATWAAPDKNPWASLPIAVLKRHIDVPVPSPGAPGLFAFADPERLRAAMTGAGFSDVAIDEVRVGREFSDGRAYFDFIIELAGPIAALFGRLRPEQKQPVAGEIASEAEKTRSGGRLVIPGLAWVASASK